MDFTHPFTPYASAWAGFDDLLGDVLGRKDTAYYAPTRDRFNLYHLLYHDASAHVTPSNSPEIPETPEIPKSCITISLLPNYYLAPAIPCVYLTSKSLDHQPWPLASVKNLSQFWRPPGVTFLRRNEGEIVVAELLQDQSTVLIRTGDIARLFCKLARLSCPFYHALCIKSETRTERASAPRASPSAPPKATATQGL